jgi:hypothetical protein
MSKDLIKWSELSRKLSGSDNSIRPNKIALKDAQDKATMELLNSLTYGDEVILNNMFTLYHYFEEDCIVLVLTESWEQVLQVLYDDEGIIFESI